jgi:hypothetical protein
MGNLLLTTSLADVPEWPARLAQADRGVLHLSLGQAGQS